MEFYIQRSTTDGYREKEIYIHECYRMKVCRITTFSTRHFDFTIDPLYNDIPDVDNLYYSYHKQLYNSLDNGSLYCKIGGICVDSEMGIDLSMPSHKSMCNHYTYFNKHRVNDRNLR